MGVRRRGATVRRMETLQLDDTTGKCLDWLYLYCVKYTDNPAAVTKSEVIRAAIELSFTMSTNKRNGRRILGDRYELLFARACEMVARKLP